MSGPGGYGGPGGSGEYGQWGVRGQRGQRARQRGWWSENAWRVAAIVFLLIPGYVVAETWQDWERRERMVDHVTVLSPGRDAVGNGATFRLETMREETKAGSSFGSKVILPRDSRLIVVRLKHRGPSTACKVRITDSRGRVWRGSSPELSRIEVGKAPKDCPSEDKKAADRRKGVQPEPGGWTTLEVPFLVPKDAAGLRAEVQLDPYGSMKWQQLTPG